MKLNFGPIDIVITVILVLSLVLGFFKGFSKKRLSSFASECGSLVAYLLGGPLSNLLCQTNLGSNIASGYLKLLPTTDAFTASISLDAAKRSQQCSTALNEIHIFPLFHGIFITRVNDLTSSVGQGLASSFSQLTILGVTYLVLFLLTFIIIKAIFSPLWKDDSLFGEDGKTATGRVFGMIRMLFKSVLLIFSCMLVITLVSQLMVKYGNTALEDWLDGQLHLNDTSYFSLGRLFYNTTTSFWQWISLQAD